MFQIIKDKYKSLTQKSNKQIVTKLLNEIVSNSYYDSNTNTLVINTPTNLILKSNGSIVTIADEGNIVNVAKFIHLNPDLSEQTMINIRKLDKGLNEVLDPTPTLLED